MIKEKGVNRTEGQQSLCQIKKKMTREETEECKDSRRVVMRLSVRTRPEISVT